MTTEPAFDFNEATSSSSSPDPSTTNTDPNYNPFNFNSGGDATSSSSSESPSTTDPNYNPFNFNSGSDPATSATANKSTGHTPGFYAGIVIGIIALLVLVGLGVWFGLRRRQVARQRRGVMGKVEEKEEEVYGKGGSESEKPPGYTQVVAKGVSEKEQMG